MLKILMPSSRLKRSQQVSNYCNCAHGLSLVKIQFFSKNRHLMQISQPSLTIFDVKFIFTLFGCHEICHVAHPLFWIKQIQRTSVGSSLSFEALEYIAYFLILSFLCNFNFPTRLLEILRAL